MQFGKMTKIDGVDFTMPPNPEATEILLNSLKDTDKPEVYSGCTGWSLKEWVGTYYPSGTKPKDFLYEYAKQFNTIELNSTYYRIPDKSTIEKWFAQTGPDFKFAPKIPQAISHSSDLSLGTDLIDKFCDSILGLGSKLGISFLQLPPNFSPSHIRVLNNFLKRFPVNEVPLSIELRNENWFVKRDMEIFQELLMEYGVGIVMSDVAGRRDALHMYLSNDSVMIRFVGNDLHASDFNRLDAWIDRMKNLLVKIKTVYFFHHQEESLNAPETVSYFNRKMNEQFGFNLKIPTKYTDFQMSLF